MCLALCFVLVVVLLPLLTELAACDIAMMLRCLFSRLTTPFAVCVSLLVCSRAFLQHIAFGLCFEVCVWHSCRHLIVHLGSLHVQHN